MVGKFSWVKKDVYPLIAAVSAGVGMLAYSSARSFNQGYGVEWKKSVRNEQIKPEADAYNPDSYRTTGFYRFMSKWIAPHTHAKGELCAMDNRGKPSTQYEHSVYRT